LSGATSQSGVCTFTDRSAGAHARGADDELVWVDPLLEMVNDWRGFIGEDITGGRDGVLSST